MFVLDVATKTETNLINNFDVLLMKSISMNINLGPKQFWQFKYV